MHIDFDMSDKFKISSGQVGNLSQNILLELKNDKDFLDVTLVCDGYKQIHAHKVVLASFSPFFKSILKTNPHQHPLIYLKGLEENDLNSILTFIYTGEVTVNQDSLENLLQSSRDLQIKGMFEDETTNLNEKSQHGCVRWALHTITCNHVGISI